uniref:Uncharacterized protein n=1 Tax=viral metagenome TaxID=1070528 RepID=A0A6M3X600_9ZZZZ
MGKCDMAFDSDRLEVLERALDTYRLMQEKYIGLLCETEESLKRQNKELPKTFEKNFKEQIMYWDIAMELSCVVAEERREVRDQSEDS